MPFATDTKKLDPLRTVVAKPDLLRAAVDLRVEKTLSELAEFAEYDGHRDVLSPRLDEVTDHALVVARTEIYAVRALENARSRLILERIIAASARYAPYVAVVAIAALILVGIELFPGRLLPSLTWIYPQDGDRATGMISSVISVTAFASTAVWILTARSKTRLTAIELLLSQREALLEETIAHAIQERLRIVIDEELGAETSMRVGAPSPALVELDSSQYLPAASAEHVIRFLEGHESSAIGISGPRGAGKSTILRHAVSGNGVLPVYIPAPVVYDGRELVETIFRESARSVLGEEFDTQRQMRLRRPISSRLIISVTFALLGISMVIWWFVQPETIDTGSAEERSFPYALFLGLGLASVGLFTSVPAFLLPGRRYPDRLYAAADAALERLNYLREEAATESTTSKILGPVLDIGSERSVTSAEREMSRPELAAELATFLRLAARSGKYSRIVVAIDELDKLSDADDLIKIVNHLKDLFHISGVHFLVSVSIDALDTFSARGVPARDAFDSSFDDVIEISHLTIHESVNLLKSRSIGFPTVLAMFCHAWSGGLARDAIRAGRACLESYRGLPDQGRNTAAVVRNVIVEDVRSTILGVLRMSEIGAEVARSSEFGEIASLISLHQWDDAACRFAESRRLGERERIALSGYLHATARIWHVFGEVPLSVAWVPSASDFDVAQQLAGQIAANGRDPWERWSRNELAGDCTRCAKAIEGLRGPTRD